MEQLLSEPGTPNTNKESIGTRTNIWKLRRKLFLLSDYIIVCLNLNCLRIHCIIWNIKLSRIFDSH